jgi:hypothetical protein
MDKMYPKKMCFEPALQYVLVHKQICDRQAFSPYMAFKENSASTSMLKVDYLPPLV